MNFQSFKPWLYVVYHSLILKKSSVHKILTEKHKMKEKNQIICAANPLKFYKCSRDNGDYFKDIFFPLFFFSGDMKWCNKVLRHFDEWLFWLFFCSKIDDWSNFSTCPCIPMPKSQTLTKIQQKINSHKLWWGETYVCCHLERKKLWAMFRKVN